MHDSWYLSISDTIKHKRQAGPRFFSVSVNQSKCQAVGHGQTPQWEAVAASRCSRPSSG